MALDVETVATMALALGVPEVVKASAKQAGQRGKRANVATQITPVYRVMPVSLDHHGHRIPAHIGTQALFNFKVAWGVHFLVCFYGVDIACGRRERHVDAALAGMLQELLQQKMGTFGALALNDSR